MNLDEELQRILTEEPPSDEEEYRKWDLHTKRVLALAICDVRKLTRWQMWLLGTIIVLILASLFR